MDKMAIYNRLPVFGQELVCYAEGRRIKAKRFGSRFWQKLHEYEERDEWTYEHRCSYRDDRLRDIIAYAYTYVPYYKRVMDEHGINPARIKTLDDLRLLPILTKDEVKRNINEFKSKVIRNEDIIVCPTGGTTGSGLRFLSTNNEIQEQWAVWWRYRQCHGITTDTPCGSFGGKQVVPLTQKQKPFWRHNTPNHQILFSSYHIAADTVRDYVDYITASGITWLHGYASSISELAGYMVCAGMQLPMKWVSTGSENLYAYQNQKIERAFGVKPIQHYGLTEGVANLSEYDGTLTVDEDFACVEFVPSGRMNEYRIIGTALTKYAMPLIRYDTGDVAIIDKCGKHSNRGRVIDSIGGRAVEYVVLPSGGKVGAAAISLAIHDFHFIRNMQVVQDTPEAVDVRLEIDGSADDFNETALLHSLHERFGNDMRIALHYVDRIPTTKNGKHRLVVSSLCEGGAVT